MFVFGFETESITLTTERPHAALACARAEERRGWGRERAYAKGRKTQVTTGPPCSERKRIFYLLHFHIRSVCSRAACALCKKGITYGRVKFEVQSQPRPYNHIIHVIRMLIAEGTRRQYMMVQIQSIYYLHTSRYIRDSYLQRLTADFIKFLFADYKINRFWVYARVTHVVGN